MANNEPIVAASDLDPGEIIDDSFAGAGTADGSNSIIPETQFSKDTNDRSDFFDSSMSQQSQDSEAWANIDSDNAYLNLRSRYHITQKF